MVGQTAGLGLALTAVAGLLGWGIAGRPGAHAALVFGLIAALIQTMAVRLAAPALRTGDYRGLLSKWGLGSVLRLAGVAAIPIAVSIDRATYPPLPAALGYLAVMVPLFFFEMRRFR